MSVVLKTYLFLPLVLVASDRFSVLKPPKGGTAVQIRAEGIDARVAADQRKPVAPDSSGDREKTVQRRLEKCEAARFKALGFVAGEGGVAAAGCTIQNIGLNQTVNGALVAGNCRIRDLYPSSSDLSYVDQYRVTVIQRGMLTIDLTSTAFDAYLYLVDTAYNRLDRDDDGGDGTNARINRVMQPGTYLILANTFDTSSGAYTLRTTFRTPESCPVLMLGLNESVNGRLESSDCRYSDLVLSGTDWSYVKQYRIRVVERGHLTVDMTSADLDAYLVLLDEQLNVLTRDDDGGDSTDARISRNLDPGTYVIWANSYGVSTGAYTLRSRFRTPQSCPVLDSAFNAAITGRLATTDCRLTELGLSATDQSYAKLYRVTIAQRGTLTIDLASSDFDAYVFLLTSSLSVVAQDDDSGPGTDARIVRMLNPGTYVVAVNSYSVSIGDFSLRLGFRNPAACPMREIGLDDRAIGSLNSSACRVLDLLGNDDASYVEQYRIVINQRGTLTVDLRSGDFDAYLFLLDSRYNVIADDDDGGSGTDSRIVKVLDPGTYVMFANSLGVATGGYTMQTTFRVSGPIVYLLIHGLNSSPETWDDLVTQEFSAGCPAISLPYGSTVLQPAHCFRLAFIDVWDDIDPEVTWHNGDGESYARLGQEVKLAVDRIIRDVKPSAIVLVGHSRGGLAARAYLQGLSTAPPVQFAMLTIGTPHQGSPLGRIPTWMRENLSALTHYEFKRHAPEFIRFVASPSTANLATDHNGNRQPVKTVMSKEIWDLNAGAGKLSSNVIYGQIVSRGLALGQFQLGDYLFVDALKAAGLASGTVSAMLDFVLLNLPADWRNDSDGIVPLESQRLSVLPGFSNSVWNLELRQIDHRHETSQSGSIRRILDRLVGDLAVDTGAASLADWLAETPSELEPNLYLESSTFLMERLGQPLNVRDAGQLAAVRAELGLRLGRGDEDAWASLRPAVAGANPHQAAELLRLAAHAGPARTLPMLLELAHPAQTREVRLAALVQIAALGRAGVDLPELEKALRQAFLQRDLSDKELLRTLAGGLSTTGTRVAVTTLLEFIEDGATTEEEAALVAGSLLAVRNIDAIAPLEAALRKAPGFFRRSSQIAGSALAAMGRPEATASLLDWAANVSEPDSARAAVEWLSQARDRRSWNLLSKFTAQAEFRDQALRTRLADMAKTLFRQSEPKREGPLQH